PRQGVLPTGILFDLTQSNPSIAQPALYQAVRKGEWKYQFALRQEAVVRTFYDTDNNGQIDLILSAAASKTSPLAAKAEAVLRRTRDGWAPEPPMGRLLFDPQYFKDEQMQKTLMTLVKKL